ncbi:MAG: TolC family protein [Pirellulaceae bacterium]|nr:TolC family protein [Pirellulaceae bacterium]
MRHGCLLILMLALPAAIGPGCRAPLPHSAATLAMRPQQEVALASHQAAADPLPAPPSAPASAPPSAAEGPKPPEPLPPGEATPRPPLSLAEVTESVYYAFPGLEAALHEMEIAAGKEQSASGEFDLKLKAGSQNDALGFYQTYKNAIKVEQALWNGGSAYGQYRLGRGKFPSWDGLETNDGGEFKVGFLRPLLQNAAIDQRRTDIFQATLRRQQVEPAVRALLLELTRDAANAYWDWVAAGRGLAVQRELLRVTVERNRIYEGRVKEGDLPRIELVQNERLIASREAKLVESERKLQKAGIKLSLFLRDANGQPLVPSAELLPIEFPETTLPDLSQAETLIANSLANRPELVELDVIRQQVELDLAQAQNLSRPELTATLDAAQDVGGPTPKKDKTPFQLQAGLYFEVPLERNKAQGKIRESQGKLAQLAAKRRLVENKITIEVQDAISALTLARERYLRAQENTRLAWQLVTAERQRFDAQDSDLLRVAIQETAAIEAALAEIDALAEFFQAQAAFRAATAADPLTP